MVCQIVSNNYNVNITYITYNDDNDNNNDDNNNNNKYKRYKFTRNCWNISP